MIACDCVFFVCVHMRVLVFIDMTAFVFVSHTWMSVCVCLPVVCFFANIIFGKCRLWAGRVSSTFVLCFYLSSTYCTGRHHSPSLVFRHIAPSSYSGCFITYVLLLRKCYISKRVALLLVVFFIFSRMKCRLFFYSPFAPNYFTGLWTSPHTRGMRIIQHLAIGLKLEAWTH